MATSHASLDAAATERKARLAKLKNLKRKHPDDEEVERADGENKSATLDVTSTYLSGRNYDPTTRGPKLGFESAPIADQETLEDRATEIVDATAKQAEEEEKADKPIDLFKLQPKRPNWDLKRDLQRKMDVLNVRTENAIARLVRERIEASQKSARLRTNGRGLEEGSGESEDVGMEGTTLVEGVHVREREEEEDERREREDEEMYTT